LDKKALRTAAPRPSTLTSEYQIFSFGTSLVSQFVREFQNNYFYWVYET